MLEVPRHLNDCQKEILQQFDQTCTDKNYVKRGSFFSKLKEIFKS